MVREVRAVRTAMRQEKRVANPSSEFKPDYAVPPGWILRERLEVPGISPAGFARSCGRSPKLIDDIIAGESALDVETALRFEKVLGVAASIWLGVEAEYKRHRARKKGFGAETATIE